MVYALVAKDIPLSSPLYYYVIILYTLRLVGFRFCRNTMKYCCMPKMYHTCGLSRLNETKLIFYYACDRNEFLTWTKRRQYIVFMLHVQHIIVTNSKSIAILTIKTYSSNKLICIHLITCLIWVTRWPLLLQFNNSVTSYIFHGNLLFKWPLATVSFRFNSGFIVLYLVSH